MAATPERTVLFYCDTDSDPSELPSDVVVGIVERHFEATRHQFVPPGSAQGFQTGVDWDKLVEEQGAVAVIVFNTNDACIYGASLEAQNAGLPTYELVLLPNNKALLWDCRDLKVTGEVAVAVPGLMPTGNW